ncbi:ComEC/Rec2 family competence protein [Aliiruegeria sabulilitoris]|uniref:ComEC/Rec2 family competence protein n=1 Tax=Aliiruegeria sabulilitoris TaxID=1510458 RepID=UPI000836FA72|nr:ComEC/Rec2 family competence protein [Aliiruegeria sabulilitoris]NDR56508.1 ComEC family competence protein [Pseudoruegeria sp. M32A2M]
MYAEPLPGALSDRPAATRLRISGALLAQRGHLLLWVPICLSIGIGTWFSLPNEPSSGVYWVCGALAVGLAGLGLRSGELVAPVFWGATLILIGVLLAGARAHSVTAPVLGFRYYGPIEGRIVDIDRSSSDKLRLTLDNVVLEDIRPERVPTRVRVSLHGDGPHVAPEPGLTVILTGHLSAPNGPVEPGGFEFRRLAWFERLGAVGYSRTPVLALMPADDGRAGLSVFRLRIVISEWVQARIPGAAGAFAAVILTGDRSAMPRESVEALRATNMAHLLAISGLHMGLLTGVVFSALRAGMALFPWFALRYPTRKFAAIGALLAGAAYLALSGGAVSTERAFIMVSVMLVAVLLERRAISLRSVAIAASLILVLAPEALFGAGFQMSFAATTALVAVFGLLRDYRDRLPRLPRWLAPILAVVLSSAVAGAATAPFGAAHFNRIADYGLIANLLSVPLMGALIMPAAVAVALLGPLGLAWLPLQVMRYGLEWILLVADRIAGIEGAVTYVIAPGPWVLPSLSLGFLLLIIWRGAGRWLGLCPILAAVFLWFQAERPPILIADTGGLVGVMGEGGRVLSKPRGDGFAAGNWLENDGDGADQEQAAAREGVSGPRGTRYLEVTGTRILALSGVKAAEAFSGRCEADVIVSNKPLADRPSGSCLAFDAASLRESGAVAIWMRSDGLHVETVAETSGQRLWTR